ncbi:MAG: hypothetical protein WA418_35260 [Bradyrhizobium sp.]
MVLLLKRLVAGLVIAAISLSVPVALFAFVVLFPIITCRGQGAGGNCGEAMMVSLPLALLTSPLDIYAMVFVGTWLTKWIWPQASPPPLPDGCAGP